MGQGQGFVKDVFFNGQSLGIVVWVVEIMNQGWELEALSHVDLVCLGLLRRLSRALGITFSVHHCVAQC